jgi:hypothetical protein
MNIKCKAIQVCAYPGGAWFRIFGTGLSFNDRRKHPPLFSERNGLARVLRIGWLSIRLLRAS